MLERVRSWLPGSQKTQDAPKLTVTGVELHEWFDAGRPMVLLDVRDQKSFRLGHIKGATLIPHYDLPTRMHELRQNGPIIVVAGSEARAAQAARSLRQSGLEAMHLKGGVDAWPGKLVK